MNLLAKFQKSRSLVNFCWGGSLLSILSIGLLFNPILANVTTLKVRISSELFWCIVDNLNVYRDESDDLMVAYIPSECPKSTPISLENVGNIGSSVEVTDDGYLMDNITLIMLPEDFSCFEMFSLIENRPILQYVEVTFPSCVTNF